MRELQIMEEQTLEQPKEVISQFFPESVDVVTSKGYKKIKDLHRGDKVLTHTNTFKTVQRLVKTECVVSLYRLRGAGLKEVLATDMQTFYIKKSIFDAPEWMPVKDIQVGWFIGVPDNVNIDELYPRAYVKEVMWLPIKLCVLYQRTAMTAYNLSVEKDKSFTANGYITHNHSEEVV